MVIRKIVSKLPARMLSKLVLKGILKKSVDTSDEIYQKDFKDFIFKVNWDISGAIGYQIYDQTNYSYKIGEHLDDADVLLSIPKIEHVRLMIRDDGLDLEMSRDKDRNFQLCIKDPLIIARFKEGVNPNPRSITQLPLFRDIQKQWHYGKTLFKPPEDISTEKKELESLVKKMLKDSDHISDEEYQKTFKDRIFKVNWDIQGILAYQIFEENRYTHEFGKNLDDADVTLMPTSREYAKLLFQGDPIDITHGKDAHNNFQLCVKIPMLLTRFKDPNLSPLVLSKLPFSKSFRKEEKVEEKREEYGSYIPINLSAGEYQNEVIPLKVFEYFIEKASNIVVCHCLCRINYDCQNHDKTLGCMYMGDDTKNMVLTDIQRTISKEEAVQYVKKAIDDGLIPLIGRSVGETEGQSIEDTGHFLSSCFCCTCCCINAKMISNASYAMISDNMIKKMKGLETKIDPAKCVGCGTCLEVCVFKGREIVNGKATIDPEFCLGCGRCVDVCPNGAISIQIGDSSYIDELIAKIESIVDVEDQGNKISTIS
jgi:UDP-glucose 4-epimerase